MKHATRGFREKSFFSDERNPRFRKNCTLHPIVRARHYCSRKFILTRLYTLTHHVFLSDCFRDRPPRCVVCRQETCCQLLWWLRRSPCVVFGSYKFEKRINAKLLSNSLLGDVFHCKHTKEGQPRSHFDTNEVRRG